MAATAADILIETLLEWGVDVIFGLPGDGINGIMEALRQRKDQIRFIHVRHEEAAAFMACGYAKFTGKLGVCLATSGPGGIHLLNGLYDAKLDGQPVLAITGMQYHDLIGTHTQQDVQLDRLFQDVCVYNARVMGAAHVDNVAHLACRTALARRGVAHITIPVDTQEMKVEHRSPRNKAQHNTEIFTQGAQLASELDLSRAADVLNTGKKVAILAGRGALGAAEELEQVAELLAAPIVKALLGKGAVPDDSPYTTGGLGLLGTEPSQDVISGCDTLLLCGSSFPYIEFLPKPEQARAVQIDVDPVRIGLRYPVEVGLVGDARRVLTSLRALLQRKEDRSFLNKAQSAMKEWNQLMQELGTRTDHPMKPQVVAHELGKRLAPDAVLACDSGTITTWWARQIPARRGQLHSVSGTLATMACGLPYAMAAQVAYPDRQCVAFVGDGGFCMLMAEFATCVQHKLPVKVVVIKNNTLGQIKWEQMVFLGNPEYGCDLLPIDFAAIARACGGTGLRIDDASRCGAILEEALATPGPVLIEAVVDPLEAPLPAKIKPKQAVHFAESVLKGEPDAGKIIRNVLDSKVRQLV
ncbi:MAG: thiamine pyrophosphate-binding protein [Polyangia bacterium]